jgi:5-methylcytosine-specific restriction endonuclease McrA
MAKAVGTGNLFQDTCKAVFVRITGSRYDDMLRRVKGKGFPGLPFDKDGLRTHLLKAMGGTYDGFLRCRYCAGFFTIEQIAIDHAIPLSRGGGVDLANLDYPCKLCNNRKGGTTPTEYVLLLQFLESAIPLARGDVLHRLGISVPLAAGASHNAKTIAELKQSGHWQRAQKARRLNRPRP